MQLVWKQQISRKLLNISNLKLLVIGKSVISKLKASRDPSSWASIQTKEVTMKNPPESPYITAKELSTRWQCSRSSVDRIARIAGITRIYLGNGKNGMVRFSRKEVEAYERDRMI
jgi:hypothetical protein